MDCSWVIVRVNAIKVLFGSDQEPLCSKRLINPIKTSCNYYTSLWSFLSVPASNNFFKIRKRKESNPKTVSPGTTSLTTGPPPQPPLPRIMHVTIIFHKLMWFPHFLFCVIFAPAESKFHFLWPSAAKQWKWKFFLKTMKNFHPSGNFFLGMQSVWLFLLCFVLFKSAYFQTSAIVHSFYHLK